MFANVQTNNDFHSTVDAYQRVVNSERRRVISAGFSYLISFLCDWFTAAYRWIAAYKGFIMEVPFLNDSERALIRKLADGDMSVYERCKIIYHNKLAHLGEEFQYIAECYSDHPDKNIMSSLRRKILEHSGQEMRENDIENNVSGDRATKTCESHYK
ncbi:MAG: hypothetical protein ACXU7D_04810 [Burkholderiaceae bacterium]